MNTVQTNKLAMYRGVKELLQVATETSGIAALPARLTAFVTQIALIDSLDQAQNTPIRGKVNARNAQIDALAEFTLELAGYAGSYARDHALPDLEETVDVSMADFRRLRLTRRPTLAQQVHDALVPVAAQLVSYGVTPEKLAQHQADIDAAKVAVTEPRATVTSKRSATQNLRRAFAAADESLEKHIDPLLFPLRNTEPEFYAEYRSRRQVLDLPGVTTSDDEPPATGTSPTGTTTAVAPQTTALAA